MRQIFKAILPAALALGCAGTADAYSSQIFPLISHEREYMPQQVTINTGGETCSVYYFYQPGLAKPVKAVFQAAPGKTWVAETTYALRLWQLGFIPFDQIEDYSASYSMDYDANGMITSVKLNDITATYDVRARQGYLYADPLAPLCMTAAISYTRSDEIYGQLKSTTVRGAGSDVAASWALGELYNGKYEDYYTVKRVGDALPPAEFSFSGEGETARIYDVVWDRFDNPVSFGTYTLANQYPFDGQGEFTINQFCMGANRVRSAKVEYTHPDGTTRIELNVDYTPGSDSYKAVFTANGQKAKEFGYEVLDAFGSYRLYSKSYLEDSFGGYYANPIYDYTITFNDKGDVIKFEEDDNTVFTYDLIYNEQGALTKAVVTDSDNRISTVSFSDFMKFAGVDGVGIGSEVSVAGGEGCISVSCEEPKPLAIHTLNGMLWYAEPAVEAKTVAIPRGCYIVKYGSAVRKVFVK